MQIDFMAMVERNLTFQNPTSEAKLESPTPGASREAVAETALRLVSIRPRQAEPAEEGACYRVLGRVESAPGMFLVVSDECWQCPPLDDGARGCLPAVDPAHDERIVVEGKQVVRVACVETSQAKSLCSDRVHVAACTRGCSRS